MNPALWLVECIIASGAGVLQAARQDLNFLELAAIAIGFYYWKKRGWRMRGVPSIPAFRRPALVACGIVVGAITLRLALLPVLPVPIPLINDEFSHLLLADTLLHGRVANPTHAFWQHFESLHIVQQPHYVSNYFPGHAVMLAAGRIAFANPWAGVLAECALFLAALYWALRAWMPPRWAIFGVVLAALRFAIASYWINAFHAGFLAAVGGALLFGAYPRLKAIATNTSLRNAGLGFAFGLGLAILAATRPFEGLIFAMPFAAALVWEMRKRVATLALVNVAVLLVALPALAGLGLYFQHITGSPFLTTYQISQKTYGWPMGLAWKAPAHIEHRHLEQKQYYEYELSEYEKVGSVGGFLAYLVLRLQEYWRFFLGPLLTIPLLMLGRIWKRRPMLLMGAVFAILAILTEGASPHYLAPATAVIVAIVVEGCRYLEGLRVRIAPLLLVGMAAVLVLRIGLEQAGLPYTQSVNYQSWCCRVKGDLTKARMSTELERTPGHHLVIVKAKTDPYNFYQWIFNSADIDAQKIVWARDMGPERNAELIRYFAGRTVWWVDPNVKPATRMAYSSAVAGDAAVSFAVSINDAKAAALASSPAGH